MKIKRNKKYRPKPCVKPLGIRDSAMHELSPLQALHALGHDYFTEQHVYDLLSCADLVKRTASADDPILIEAQAVVYAVADMQHRSQRTGTAGATGDEMATLRAKVGMLISYLRGVSNVDIYRASASALAEFNRLGALRV